jgi:hypothetical protein
MLESDSRLQERAEYLGTVRRRAVVLLVLWGALITTNIWNLAHGIRFPWVWGFSVVVALVGGVISFRSFRVTDRTLREIRAVVRERAAQRERLLRRGPGVRV